MALSMKRHLANLMYTDVYFSSIRTSRKDFRLRYTISTWTWIAEESTPCHGMSSWSRLVEPRICSKKKIPDKIQISINSIIYIAILSYLKKPILILFFSVQLLWFDGHRRLPVRHEVRKLAEEPIVVYQRTVADRADTDASRVLRHDGGIPSGQGCGRLLCGESEEHHKQHEHGEYDKIALIQLYAVRLCDLVEGRLTNVSYIYIYIYIYSTLCATTHTRIVHLFEYNPGVKFSKTYN